MTSIKKQIRNTAAKLLLGKTAVEDRVYPTRITNIQPEELPCIGVYTLEEVITKYDEAPKTYKKSLSLYIEISVENTSDGLADDLADDIEYQCTQVLERQDADIKSALGCLVESLDITSVHKAYENIGEKSAVGCQLVYTVEYIEDAVNRTGRQPNEADFKKAAVDWDVGTASDPDPEAQDEINIGT